MASILSDIILEPLITEKSTALSQHNKYTFKVSKDATKNTVREAFHSIFPGRKIKSIKIITTKPHRKRTKSGFIFSKVGKKAVIAVEGPRIEYFPEVA